MSDSILSKNLDETKFVFKPGNEPTPAGKVVAPWGKVPTEEEKNHVRLSRPSGLMGEIADYIYSSYHYPSLEIAVAGALTFMASIFQRAYNINRSGLNLYTVIVARSGLGKEGAASGMSSLYSAMREQGLPGVDSFIGPSDIASAQGLLRHFGDPKIGSKSFYSYKGEIGFWLQKMNDKYAKSNDTQLKGMILQLFHRSGHRQVLEGSVYSDNAKNAPLVKAPCLTILGDSTASEFYKGIDEHTINNGFISRFLVISCPSIQPEYNSNAGNVVPNPAMILKLVEWGKWCLQQSETNSVTNIGETDDARAFELAYQKECQKKEWAGGDGPSQIWNRAHIKVLRIAALLAIGNCPQNPIITVDDLLWAKVIVERGIEAVLAKFETGDVGHQSEGHEQRKLVNKILLEFFDATYYLKKWFDHYSINEKMFDDHIISLRMIQNKTSAKACFRNSANTKAALTNCLDMLCEAGTLTKFNTDTNSRNKIKATGYQINDREGLLS